jgi:hypothetical protein
MGQPTGNNVVIQQYDPNMSAGPVAASGASNQQSVMDQRTLQELVSGVQRASSAGMTALPSRDIPRDSLSMQHDEQVKPNYIPQQQHRAQDEIGSDGDYIKRYETSDDVHQNNRRSQHRLDTLEEIYTEFQMPILLGVMYFIFQMPSIRAHMLQMVPSLFNKDGNFNLIGLIVTSSSYAIAYYIISKLV